MTGNRLIHVGFGNIVNAEKIIAIVSPESAPVRRLVSQAKNDGRTIDATQGRKTKSVIVMEWFHRPKMTGGRSMPPREERRNLSLLWKMTGSSCPPSCLKRSGAEPCRKTTAMRLRDRDRVLWPKIRQRQIPIRQALHRRSMDRYRTGRHCTDAAEAGIV